FCRVSEEFMREMQPLLDQGADGKISFNVGRKHLSEFYHQLLPVLKRNAAVRQKEPELIQAYIPPEAEYAFYLEAENGVITCKPKARYGEETVSLLDNLRKNRAYEWFRNQNREEEILYYLHDLFKDIDLLKDELSCENSEDAVLSLLDGGVDRLMAMGEVHTTERFRNVNVRRKANLKVGVSIESDIMNLSITSEEIDQEDLLQILKNYQRKKKYYRLKNGDFAEVNEADIEVLSQMIETLHLSPKEFVKGNMKIPVYRALYLNKMLEQGEQIYLNRDKHFKSLIKEFKTVDDSEFEVPTSLASVMRNYQVRGFKWLKMLEHYGFGGILADDMGLGKTLQMISVLLSAKADGRKGTSLIVCPASLVYNWNEEFSRFAPELKVTPVVGSQQERAGLIGNYRESDVLVTSYDLLKRDIAEYEGIEFDYQVLDEAQYIKNHSTAAAKAVKVIKSRHRYALTGTPIENRLSELWSIFDYLMPGFLYGYDTFRKELETPIVKRKAEDASERLQKMVAPFILRRLKGDVLRDLPEKMEEIRYSRLEAEQQQLYDGQVLHMQRMIAGQDAEDFQKNKLQILAELTKIRQICCDPELLFEQYQGSSAKRLACMELIQSAIEGEHKILLFSQFTSMLELLERNLNEAGISYYKITGATPKEKRVDMVNMFNQDDTSVFLISLKAGGTGLNLTGADVVIHYDPWWNQAAQNQATDRAHRIGQTKAVSVYKLIMKDTIEEKIVMMQENKRDLADSILNGETGGLGQMSRDELMELLGA
ncbi:MAG: DEAD/DEAH box helicase, partial [Lachnospiraceae bacterium]|nr:DEAD/DEAH box helicase [Lachnospiraceae bacterium]